MKISDCLLRTEEIMEKSGQFCIPMCLNGGICHYFMLHCGCSPKINF